jgi:hypothetical protein
MKHLKKFEAHQRKYDTIQGKDIAECFYEFIEDFGGSIDTRRSDPFGDTGYFDNASIYGAKNCQIDINKTWFANTYCYHFSYRNSGSSYRGDLPNGYYKNFDGVNGEYKTALEKGTKRAMSLLDIDASRVHIGSFSAHGGQLDIMFFPNESNPSFKEYKDVELYGCNAIVELDKLGYYLQCNLIRHNNMFQVYNLNHQIQSMPCIIGYIDCYYAYFNSLFAFDDEEKLASKKPFEKWMMKLWEDVCKKVGITKNFQRIFKHYKITTPQFMRYIADHQDTFDAKQFSGK